MTALEAHLFLLSTSLVLGLFGPFAVGKSCFRHSEMSRVWEKQEGEIYFWLYLTTKIWV